MKRQRIATTRRTEEAYLNRYILLTRRLIVRCMTECDYERAHQLAVVNSMLRHRLFQLFRRPSGNPEALPKGTKQTYSTRF